MIPEYLKYSQTHTWFFVEHEKKAAEKSGKTITVGFTKHFVDDLGVLLHLDLPSVGDEILPGIPIGEIETLDTLVDITLPLGGEVIAINERLCDNLEILCRDPYSKGWLIKLITKEIHIIERLLSAEAYARHINLRQSAVPPANRKRKNKIK